MNSPKWWQRAIIYQIYPRSFNDADGDGIGDLRGITARLPYLAELGVDAVWLSPIFPSPMADFGYDVADYCDIDPIFGTLEDFDCLLASAHQRRIKVLLDLVPNHTSDRHPWFVESRISRASPRRDWYIWRDPAPGGGAPNNWLSEFGGSAWEFDARTGQYYYHAFLAAQPDLNWRNPAVRNAIYEVMRFWFRRGVDGFRIDVLWHLIKDDQFRDNPEDRNARADEPPHRRVIPLYTADRPEMQEVVAELRCIADEFEDRVLIGEIYLPFERLIAYYGQDLRGVHLPFNFSLLQTPWQARAVARVIDQYESALPAGGWPNWVLGNHDRPRVASRVGDKQARIAAMLLFTLRGTPTLYYGDEIGMRQVSIGADQVQDPVEKNLPGHSLGRDGARTPMQWDATDNAGFSFGNPWLPVADDYRRRNLANQRGEATSIYHLHRRLIDLRHARRALSDGSYRPIAAGGDLLLFAREHGHDRVVVALNFGGESSSLDVAQWRLRGTVLLSCFGDREGATIGDRLDLQAHDGLIIEVGTDFEIPSSSL